MFRTAHMVHARSGDLESMTAHRRRITSVIILVAVAPISRAQQPSEPGRIPAGWAAYVRAFDAYTSADSIVGGATLTMRDGVVLAHHEYGFGDRALGQRVDTNTIFHWGSITKTLTAVAIMQLVERGKVSLDDRVTTYLPELRRVHDAFGSIDSVTIRMLLSHSAGFQGATWPYTQGRPWEPFEPTSWEQLVAMMPYQEIAFKPGTRFSYSNPGFIYLGRIIELVSGDPWEAYIQKNIFTPLSMTRSYFGATPYHLAQWRSNNYDVELDSTKHLRLVTNGRDFNPGITIPNGGWNSPLGDLARWVAFLTNATHGDMATQRLYDIVLPHARLESMWRPQHPMTASGQTGPFIGLSFFLEPQRIAADTVTLVGHTGSQAGFRAFVYWNPRTRAAVIAAFNTGNDTPGARRSLAVRGDAQALLLPPK